LFPDILIDLLGNLIKSHLPKIPPLAIQSGFALMQNIGGCQTCPALAYTFLELSEQLLPTLKDPFTGYRNVVIYDWPCEIGFPKSIPDFQIAKFVYLPRPLFRRRTAKEFRLIHLCADTFSGILPP
jgi:hypothetical protein